MNDESYFREREKGGLHRIEAERARNDLQAARARGNRLVNEAVDADKMRYALEAILRICGDCTCKQKKSCISCTARIGLGYLLETPVKHTSLTRSALRRRRGRGHGPRYGGGR